MTTNPKASMLERAARAVAIASNAETAARASIGQEPFVNDGHRAVARAVLEAVRTPSDKMVRAGDAWRTHCSDTDSLWQEMAQAALYPEDYPGSEATFEAVDHAEAN